MTNLDTIVNCFSDLVFDLKTALDSGAVNKEMLTKMSTAEASTAILKAVIYTRNIELHMDMNNLFDLWSKAYKKSNEASQVRLPEDLMSKPGAAESLSIDHVDQRAFNNKLNELEHACIELQETIYSTYKTRRMRFGF